MSDLFLLRHFTAKKFKEILFFPVLLFFCFFSSLGLWFICFSFLIFLTKDDNSSLSMYLPNSTDYEYGTLGKSLTVSEAEFS